MTKTSSPADDTTDSPGALLRRVHAAMGADQLADALAAVRTRRAALRTATDDTDDHGVHDAVAQLLRDGQLPDDLAAPGIAARRRTEAINIEATAINRIENELLIRRRAVYADRADDGLDVLRPLLDQIVTAARDTVDQLDGATTAEEALDSGAGDAWRDLRDLAHRYRNLRFVQTRVVSDATREHRDTPGTPAREAGVSPAAQRLVRLAGYVDQPEQHVTDVAMLFAVGPSRSEPRGRDAAYPWAVGDPWSDLVWLVTADATPVIPDVAELTATRDRLHALANDTDAA